MNIDPVTEMTKGIPLLNSKQAYDLEHKVTAKQMREITGPILVKVEHEEKPSEWIDERARETMSRCNFDGMIDSEYETTKLWHHLQAIKDYLDR